MPQQRQIFTPLSTGKQLTPSAEADTSISQHSKYKREWVQEGLTAGQDADDEPGTRAASSHGPAPVGVRVIPGEASAVDPQTRGHLAPQHQVVGYEDTRQNHPATLTPQASAAVPYPLATNAVIPQSTAAATVPPPGSPCTPYSTPVSSRASPISSH